jgi:hypothetical protein
LEEAIARRIADAAASLAGTAEHVPTRSLLGRLRIALRLPAGEGLKQLRSWLGDTRGALRRPAMRQLVACHLGESGRRWSLYDWLRDNAKRNDLGRVLGYEDLARHHHFINEEAARTMLHSAEREIPTRAAYIDAVLAALTRRQTGPSSNGETPHAR